MLMNLILVELCGLNDLEYVSREEIAFNLGSGGMES